MSNPCANGPRASSAVRTSRGAGATAFLVVLLGTTLAHAEPPDVKALLPAGGTRGTTIEVAVRGKLGTRPVSVWASHDGLQVTVPEKGETVSVEVAPDTPPGRHWLRFHNAEGASVLRPFVVGLLPEAKEEEPNDRLGEAPAIDSAGTVVNGVLSKNGEVDGFAVELQAGQTLVAAMEANIVLGSPMDGVLQIVSDRGFVLDQNDDAVGFDPRVVFTAPADGTYFVRTFAFPATPNSSIRFSGGEDFVYRLTLTTGPFVHHPTPLAVSQSPEQSVTPVGWNLDGLKTSLAPATDDSDARTLVVDPPQAGGNLTVAVTPHPSLLEAETAADPLTAPVIVTGHVSEAGESDEFPFDAKKGDKLTIRVASRSLGFPLDPVLEVLDDKDAVVKRVDDAGRNEFDPELAFTAPGDGRYRLRVSDLFGNGGPLFAYRLSLLTPTPDYAASVAGDRFTVTIGKPLEIPVTIDRSDGFAGELRVAVENLPEGVTAESVTSAAKGDSAKKVTLKLEATEAVRLERPFRIVTVPVDAAQGDAESRRFATAPVDGLATSTDDLWLTVKPADAAGEK